jgi:hypothetical protein
MAGSLLERGLLNGASSVQAKQANSVAPNSSLAFASGSDKIPPISTGTPWAASERIPGRLGREFEIFEIGSQPEVFET